MSSSECSYLEANDMVNAIRSRLALSQIAEGGEDEEMYDAISKSVWC